MTVTNFIPTVWAGSILRALDELLVYGAPQVINTDYEGDISNVGDSVRILMVGEVQVKDYVRNQDIDPPDDLTDAALTLFINQHRYFNFALDDVDRAQAQGGLMDEAARSAGGGLRKVMDSYIASLYTDIATGNFIGSDGAPVTGFNANARLAYQQLTKLRTKLDESDTPEDGRWAIVPPWYEEYLINDDRFIAYGSGRNGDVLANGRIGRAAGIEVFKSNAVPNVAGEKYKILGGHRIAWSRAQQILKTEGYRPERRMADAIKGLHVYGAKVLRPDKLACLVASDR